MGTDLAQYTPLAPAILLTIGFAAILQRAGLLLPGSGRRAGWSGLVGVSLVACASVTVFSHLGGRFATFPSALQVVLVLGSLAFAALWALASKPRVRP